jgi:cell fate (sporulation/competence/biofilm development) regulator YlbF (YheA/YmcA/DUF963 family)
LENIYNKTHELGKLLKQSDLIKEFKTLKSQIEMNSNLKTIIEDFNKKQLESQKYIFEGKEIPKKEMEMLQELYSVVARDPVAFKFLEIQMKVATMMNDITKILSQSIEE